MRRPSSSSVPKFIRESVWWGFEPPFGNAHWRKGFYPFVMVADKDADTLRVDLQGEPIWLSNLQHGLLRQHEHTGKWSVDWGLPFNMHKPQALFERGLELSDLCMFPGGRLMAPCDKSGTLFEICGPWDNPKLQRRWDAVQEGEGGYAAHGRAGQSAWARKLEWVTQTPDPYKFLCGSHGDHVRPGSLNVVYLAVDPEDPTREPEHTYLDGSPFYHAIREAACVHVEGALNPESFLVHEAVEYSPARNKFLVLPRQVSMENYSREIENRRGSNLCFTCDIGIDLKRKKLELNDFSLVEVGTLDPLRGFSCAYFVPCAHGAPDTLVGALKTVELDGRWKWRELAFETTTKGRKEVATFFTLFRLSPCGTEAEVLLEDQLIPGSTKYEGLAFVW